MKLSIIIPVYNVDNSYLNACINSILMQTFKDYELICVNDCSPNLENLPLLEEFQKQDPRIKVINLPQNMGASEARNIGIEAVQGEYLTFVDCDDFLNWDYYEILINELEKNQADLVMCGFVRINENNKVTKVRMQINSVANVDDFLVKKSQFESLSYSSCNKIYRFECVKSLRFPKGVKLAEDVYYNFNAFLNSAKTVTTSLTTYNYRINPNSVTNREKDGISAITTNLKVLHLLIDDFEKMTLNKTVEKAVINYFYYRFIRYANKFVRIENGACKNSLWSDYVDSYQQDLKRIKDYNSKLYNCLGATFANKSLPKFLALKIIYYKYLLKGSK